MVEKIPMTAAGYTVLEAELKHCQSVERPRIIQQITEARSHGDLSENAEYHAAKEQQSLNEGRIDELQDKLARAEIIDVSKLSGDTITFGATVTLVDEDTEEKKVWQIVGEPEADAKKGRISITSPLAKALIGKAKGAVTIPRGSLESRACPTSATYVAALRQDKPVILYCAGGNRAALAGKTLLELGYTDVRNLGGFRDWVAAGGEVER